MYKERYNEDNNNNNNKRKDIIRNELNKYKEIIKNEIDNGYQHHHQQLLHLQQQHHHQYHQHLQFQQQHHQQHQHQNQNQNQQHIQHKQQQNQQYQQQKEKNQYNSNNNNSNRSSSSLSSLPLSLVTEGALGSLSKSLLSSSSNKNSTLIDKSDLYAFELKKQIYEHKERKRKQKDEDDYYNNKYYNGWGIDDKKIQLNHQNQPNQQISKVSINNDDDNGYKDVNHNHNININNNYKSKLSNDLKNKQNQQNQEEQYESPPLSNRSNQSSIISGKNSEYKYLNIVDDSKSLQHNSHIGFDQESKTQNIQTKTYHKNNEASYDHSQIILKYLDDNQRLIKSIKNEIDILNDKLRVCEKQHKFLINELHQNGNIVSHGSLDGKLLFETNDTQKELIYRDSFSSANAARSNRFVHFGNSNITNYNSTIKSTETAFGSGDFDDYGNEYKNNTHGEYNPNQNNEYNEDEYDIHSIVDEKDVEPLHVDAQYFIYVAEKPNSQTNSHNTQRALGKTNAGTSGATSGDHNTSTEYEEYEEEDEEDEEEEDDDEEDDEELKSNQNKKQANKDEEINKERSYAALVALQRAAATYTSSEDEDFNDEDFNDEKATPLQPAKLIDKISTPPIEPLGSPSASKTPHRFKANATKEEIIKAKNELLSANSGSPVKPITSPNQDIEQGAPFRKSHSLTSSGSFLLLDSEQGDVGDVFAKGGTIDFRI